MLLIAASGNKAKIREISEVMAPLGFEVKSCGELGFEGDIDETGSSFAENASIKAEVVYRALKDKYADAAVLADDSGLSVDALGGRPGIYSHRYAGENADDSQRIAKLLGELAGHADRTARFVCAMCCIGRFGRIEVEGECIGQIGFEERGSNGFGYDPIFMFGDKSFAELDADNKNKVSHRANALSALRAALCEKI